MMIQRFFFRILFFLIGIVIFEAQPIISMQQKDDIEKIKAGMQTVNAKLESDFQRLRDLAYTQVVIALGRTGSGKSTLINFLADKHLVAGKEDGAWKIDVEDPLEGIEPGHESASKTTEPSFWYDQATSTVYFDCPGLGDTRDERYDIVNMYAINRLFEKLRGVDIKFLIPLTESSIQARSDEFQRTMNILGESFPDVIDSFGQASGLVVTRQRDSVRQDVSDKLNKVAGDGSLRISPMARRLINALRNPAQIALFPNPQNIGNFLGVGTPERAQVRADILSVLAQARGMQNLSPTLMISEDSKNFVRKLGASLNDELYQFLCSNVLDGIYAFCNTEIERAGDLQNLRSNFRTLAQDLGNIGTDNIGVFKDCLRAVLETCGMQREYREFEKKVNCINFLQKSNPEISYPLHMWLNSLLSAKNSVEKLAALPKITPNPLDNIVLIEGFLIGTSDVNSAIQERMLRPGCRIDIWSLNAFLFNENITKNGLSLSFMAPFTKVIGGVRRTINLNGANGASGADGNNGINGPGANGQPGQHGEHGGHFYGKVGSFNNSDQLTIHTSGGKGGKGGNGGNGADGMAATHGVPGQQTGQIGNRVFYQDQGIDGTPGKDAGQGGRRGDGGIQGTAAIDGAVGWSHVSVNGTPGVNGTHGSPGTGGEYAKRCNREEITGLTQQVAHHYEIDVPYQHTYKQEYRHHYFIGHTTKERDVTETRFKKEARVNHVTVPAPNKWQINPGHLAARVPPRLPNGNVPGSFNSVNQLAQQPAQALSRNALCDAYRAYYDQHRGIPLVKPFPNL
jgi:energy-coupling factor transporter ATP-binding protein EcfA2